MPGPGTAARISSQIVSHAYEPPVPGRLAPASLNVTSQKVIIPPVRFEDCVENRAEKRSGAKQRFDADIQHHARNRYSRNSKRTVRPTIYRENNASSTSPIPGINPMKPLRPYPKSAGKGESIIEPAGEGLHIGCARVHDLRAHFALEFLTGEGDYYLSQPPTY